MSASINQRPVSTKLGLSYDDSHTYVLIASAGLGVWLFEHSVGRASVPVGPAVACVAHPLTVHGHVTNVRFIENVIGGHMMEVRVATGRTVHWCTVVRRCRSQ